MIDGELDRKTNGTLLIKLRYDTKSLQFIVNTPEALAVEVPAISIVLLLLISISIAMLLPLIG